MMKYASRAVMAFVSSLFVGAFPIGAAQAAPEPVFPFNVVYVAESLAGTPFAPVSRPTLRIARDGQAGGTAGCNRYAGRATLAGAKLSFGPLAMTRMACFGAGADNEARFAPAIGTASGWRFERRVLVIDTANGPLRLRRR